MTDGSAGSGLRLERSAGLLRITLNRPDRLNAFAGTMRDDLAAAIEGAAADRDVRVIVITGAGRAFCAGADVAVITEMLGQGDEATFQANVEAGMRAVRAIAAAPQPVIAAVNGVAVGAGASLAIACDFRIASEAAQIGFTFNRIGLHPDWGATHFLPRLVGSGRAAELISSARMLKAPEASAIGLFEILTSPEEFESTVAATASALAAKPPIALALAKSSLAGGAGPDALDAALHRELAAQMRCFQTADLREGLAAFHEKRSPSFTGG